MVKRRPCAVCGTTPVDVHHINSRGSGGDDSLANLVALCRFHHVELHQIGRYTFADKYQLETILGERDRKSVV